MRIIHITFSLLNAGKENMLVDIANEQSKLGHDTAILLINNSVDEDIKDRIDGNTSFFNLRRERSADFLFSMFRFIYVLHFKFRPDVIHVHDSSLGIYLKKMTRIPIVLTVHGPGIDVEPMQHYDKCFAISRSVKKNVESRGGPECDVIYNGIYTIKIRRKESYSTKGEFKIIQVKRLNHERKGQDLLIRAAQKLVNHHQKKTMKFYLVGEGESRPFLEQLIQELGLSNYVFLLGNWNRDRVYSELADYDLFVHPSRYEGFGLAVTEAMAAKVPVVASNIEGPAEILGHGKFGLLFENENVEALVEQIRKAEKLFEEGSVYQLAEKSYRHCLKHFDIQQTAKNYCDSYPIS